VLLRHCHADAHRQHPPLTLTADAHKTAKSITVADITTTAKTHRQGPPSRQDQCHHSLCSIGQSINQSYTHFP